MTPRPTIGDLITNATSVLAHAGIPEARREARLLACHALNLRSEITLAHPQRPVAETGQRRFETAVTRRALREPMAYILGSREFWSLEFRVTRHTLVPRPESETVVEVALEFLAQRQAAPRILDLGTGSGCLLLALLSEVPAASGIGIDMSPAALAIACENARSLGLEERATFLCANWTSALSGAFDIVVANPPYIPDPDLDALAPEVRRFEPRIALSAGEDGLAAYRAILPELPRVLAPDAVAVLEIGAGQAAAIADLAEDQGMQVVGTRNDLAGWPRCVVITARP